MVITYTYGEKLYINLTNRCPNACEFCVREQGRGSGRRGQPVARARTDQGRGAGGTQNSAT